LDTWSKYIEQISFQSVLYCINGIIDGAHVMAGHFMPWGLLHCRCTL